MNRPEPKFEATMLQRAPEKWLARKQKAKNVIFSKKTFLPKSFKMSKTSRPEPKFEGKVFQTKNWQNVRGKQEPILIKFAQLFFSKITQNVEKK